MSKKNEQVKSISFKDTEYFLIEALNKAMENEFTSASFIIKRALRKDLKERGDLE